MAIENIYEIFILQDENFIAEAFHILLGREPDAQGMAYYCGRLAAGFSRASIIYQLSQSAEAISPIPPLSGLAPLIASERHSRRWYRRFFTTHKSSASLQQQDHLDMVLKGLRRAVQEENARSTELLRTELEKLQNRMDALLVQPGQTTGIATENIGLDGNIPAGLSASARSFFAGLKTATKNKHKELR